MDRLISLDTAIFRFINQHLKNGFFDAVLPYLDSNVFFVPTLVLFGAWLTWKGGTRGRLFVCFLLLTFVLGDGVLVSGLKNFIDRPRPYATLLDVHLPVGEMSNPSMPSGHAANWFSAAAVAFFYYRRTLWFMLPMAVLVAFSRVYLGVHYPTDVIAGGLIGVGYAIAILWTTEGLWRVLGARWFPVWYASLPSFLPPATVPGPSGLERGETFERADSLILDAQWRRLAYVLTVLVLLGHWVYLLVGRIQLSEDEAYQWLWSKHLALSYYSKPPLIAYMQFLGTSIWGDTAFGVRFFSPLLAAVTSALVVRFLAREVNGFTACMSVLVATATPLLMVGGTLMTIDSLSVLFWVAAMVTGWQAANGGSTRVWCWTGLWIGLGFLSKYVAFFQWVCLAVFLALWAPSRVQLRRPGIYLALLISLLCTAPVWIWNAQHDWITVTHLADRGGLSRTWEPSLRFVWDFLWSEAGLLNPVFFVGTLWAAIALWKKPGRSALAIYLFCMGAPLFLIYFFLAFRARVQPNWIAPAVLPLFCLMLLHWQGRWREGVGAVRHWFLAGMTIGWVAVACLHDTRVVAKLFGRPLSPEMDPLRRVLGWKEMARVVEQARSEFLREDKPVFLIGDHYGTTSLLSFYMAEAKAGVPHRPLVYYLSTETPKNQFFFWPGYEARKGENALYVAQVRRRSAAVPARLQQQFESVEDLGVRDVQYRGRVYHRIQLFACRSLR